MHIKYFFLTFLNIVIVEYGFGLLLSFNVVIIIIMNIYFPEPSLVLASMFFYFEPDNNFVIRYILRNR
jgi:hypothetical protein